MPDSKGAPAAPGDEVDVEPLATVAGRMAQAAVAWLGSLTRAQLDKAHHDFPAWAERTRWYYTPTEQGGLPLVEMTPAQQRQAHRLLASGLSRPGYATAATIMGLENVLDAVEGWQVPYPGRGGPSRGRDPLMYYVTVFGDPGGAAWGWRVGGHHLAVNYTLVGGQVAASPLFLGAHPAVASLVGPGVLRPLAGEEDLARDLLATLDRDQLAAAVLAPAPPPDIVQANRAAVDPGALPRPTWELFAMRLPDPAVATMRARDQALRAWMGLRDAHLAAVRYQPTPAGLPGAGMRPAQRALLLGLVRQYLDRLPAALAAPRLDRLGGTGLDEVHFAWAGEAARGAPHYYRVHGPRLLVEYANAQDGADHVHSVWRDPAGDFGADLLGHAQP